MSEMNKTREFHKRQEKKQSFLRAAPYRPVQDSSFVGIGKEVQWYTGLPLPSVGVTG